MKAEFIPHHYCAGYQQIHLMLLFMNVESIAGMTTHKYITKEANFVPETQLSWVLLNVIRCVLGGSISCLL